MHTHAIQSSRLWSGIFAVLNLLPYESAIMSLTRPRLPASPNLQSQVASSATYDGGISCNMAMSSSDRKDHARTFIHIAKDVLKHWQELYSLYNLDAADDDESALKTSKDMPIRERCRFLCGLFGTSSRVPRQDLSAFVRSSEPIRWPIIDGRIRDTYAGYCGAAWSLRTPARR